MRKSLLNTLFYFLADGEDVISPLYDGISLVGPYAIAVCLTLSIFWGVFLGVKYAKAEDASEKEKLHKVLVNFCIGAITILILICIIYAIREPLANYIDAN